MLRIELMIHFDDTTDTKKLVIIDNDEFETQIYL